MSTHSKSLGAIALVVALFGLGVAFDGDSPTTPAPSAPVLREVTNFDFTEQAANEDIYINWSEWGCFQQRFFRIRIAGDDPSNAEVFVLNSHTANEPLESVRSLTPLAEEVLTSGTIPLSVVERAGVALWLLRIRGDSDRRCTTSVRLDLYRVTKTPKGESIEHEAMVDSSCDFTSGWTESLNSLITDALSTK